MQTHNEKGTGRMSSHVQQVNAEQSSDSYSSHNTTEDHSSLQILKICLNHMISDVLNLQPMQNSQGKAWVWVATDFAEGEPSDEKLAIK